MEAIDAFRFEQLLHRARELMALHEPERARWSVQRALDLWSGAALVDLEGWPPGEEAARRWEEQRRDAEERVRIFGAEPAEVLQDTDIQVRER